MRLKMRYGKSSSFVAVGILFVSLLFSEGPPPSSSTEDASHPLTIPELIDIALKNNPSTKKVYWNAQRAAATVGIAESAYYPHVNAEGSAEYRDQHNPRTDTAKYTADLCLSMLLFDCGKTSASVAATKELLKAAAWNVDWNVQEVLASVFDATYNMLYAQEAYDATLITVLEAEKMVVAARELQRVGLKPISDVYTAESILYTSKMDLSDKKQLVKNSEASLSLACGLPSTTHLNIASVDLSTAPQEEHLDHLIAYAYEHRADLQGKQAQVAAALDTLEKEKAAAYPEFSCYARSGIEQTRHTSRNEMNQRIHSRSKPTHSTVGLKVEIPLFTGFELTYKKNAALAESNLTQAEKSLLQLEIARDVAFATYSLESAQEKLPDAQHNIENAKKAFDSTFERYTAGKSDIAELYNAQQQVSDARIQYATVKTQWLSAIANLAYATGTLHA